MESWIWPRFRGSPSSTSSLPVDRMPTRGAGYTESMSHPLAAAAAMCRAARRVPGGKDPVAGAGVAAGPSDERGGRRHLTDGDPGGAQVGVLDRDHGIRAVRDRGAGHDPSDLAGLDRRVLHGPGGQIGDDRERDRVSRQSPRGGRRGARRSRPCSSCRRRGCRPGRSRRRRAPGRRPRPAGAAGAAAVRARRGSLPGVPRRRCWMPGCHGDHSSDPPPRIREVRRPRKYVRHTENEGDTRENGHFGARTARSAAELLRFR